VSLSTHRALVIQPWAARPTPNERTGPRPVWRSPLGTGLSAWDGRATVCISAWPTTSRPRARDDRFPRSTPEPRPSSRHLHAGHHLANNQAPARLTPGHLVKLGFDVVFSSFRHVINGSLTLVFLAQHLTRSWRAFSHDAHHQRLLTAAAQGGLRPSPAGRPRRTTSPERPVPPPSPMQHRINQSDLSTSILLVAFVAHARRLLARAVRQRALRGWSDAASPASP